jgi:hypothetical protein
MRSPKHLFTIAGPLLALVVCVGLASDASAARKYQATGFQRANLGQINIPLQFVISAPTMIGGHSIHLGFPNDDAPLDFEITATGKSPANILFPTNAQGTMATFSALAPLMGTNNVQITTKFTFSGPVAAVKFSPLGGPGSFSFCPGSVQGLPGSACPLTSMGAPNLAAPPQGGGTRNGRIVYTGGGGFGGVAQTFLTGSGSVTAAAQGFGFGSPIFQAAHRTIANSGTQANGGAYGQTSTVMAAPQLYTQPRTQPTTNGTISAAQVGPNVTSMNALTSCPATSMGGAFPNIPLTGSLACVVGTGPPKIVAAATTLQTAFPWTTGTVLAQQTTNTFANGVGDIVTLTGSDARTPRGIGNITLVSGRIALRISVQTTTNTPTGTLSLTISEKAPSMNAGGLAAAALLMVIGTGYVMRRRF